jgi:RNA polymerase primary sigma factor
MWDNEQLASDLCMQRDSKRGPGTTALIIGYLHYNESDSDNSPKDLSHEIMNNIAKWFTPAIAENKLRAYVKFIDTVDDELEEVTSEKVDVENHMEPFFDMLIKDVADETSTTLSEPGDVVRLKVPLIVPERRLEGHEHDEFTHQAKLLIRYARDDEKDQLFQHMSFNRGVGMTVNFKSFRNITFGAIPFHAILLCGTSAGYDKKTDSLADQFLRTAEPPAHDRWGPTDELKTDYKLGGIKKIKDFFDEAKKSIKSQVGPITPKGTDGPNFLKNFFRFDIVNPASPAFTVKEVDRIIDGDSMALNIKVRKSGPAEKKIFEMEPIVYLEDESGHAGQGQSATVEVKEVVPVSGCSEDNGRILIKPEKRIGTFKVLLDEDKLLVPQHLSVFDVELKSIRGRETD